MSTSRVLGRGSFGVVEKIVTFQGNFAKKTLTLSNDNNENIALKRRFRREVEYQATFNHKNIVPILTSDLESDSPSFTMPLAVCQLGSEFSQNISISFLEKIEIVNMILDGIDEIHSTGHIHRDIKPPNILRFNAQNNGYYYAITDFGLVANRESRDTTTLTQTSMAMGTMAYMAPECYGAANSATYLSDIYSLGVVLKFLVDGGEDLGIPFRERISNSIISDIINKCTKDNPDDRYTSVANLREEFNMAVQGKDRW